MATTDQDYWANAPAEELGKKLASKISDLYNDTYVGNARTRERRAYRYYYGSDPYGVHATSQVLRGGDIGELALIRVNHARSLVNTLVNLITASKVVWQPKPVNTDYESILQTEMAQSLLEYYWTEAGVSELCGRALEQAVFLAESFILLEWDESAGDDYAAIDGQVIKTGDVAFRSISPWDVIRDPTKQSFDALDWVAVRRMTNKYALAAKYPDRKEAIFSAPENLYQSQSLMTNTVESDDVEIYEFFHRKTAATPDGIQGCLLSSGEFLYPPGPLELGYIPLIRWFAMDQNSTPFAYTPYFDILGIQELMDSLQTIIASNQTTLGTQLIAFETGSEISPDDVGGGMKALYYPQGATPPKAIDLLKTAPEIFTHLKDLQNQQELVMGLNSVVRGEPQSGEQSGSALALLSSQALQQSSTIQGHHVRAIELLGNCLFDLLRRNLSLPRTISLIGKANQFMVKDSNFTGKSFDGIRKIQVQVGNPMQQTASGRMEIARDLMQMGVLKTPEQYLDVMETGRLEPATQSLKRELDLIRSENEQLSRGEDPPVLVLDDHLLHAREHRAVLANPQARKNPNTTQAVLAHIAEHEKQYYTAPPATLLMVGQHPPMMPPNGPPPPPGLEPPQGPPPVGPPPQNPAAGQLPPPAKMPTNPATGQKAPLPPLPGK